MSESPKTATPKEAEPMVERRGWDEFQKAGLLWWVNRGLHLFGWALVLSHAKDEETGETYITECYPARCKFRGFTHDIESAGFVNLTNHIAKQLPDMIKDLDA